MFNFEKLMGIVRTALATVGGALVGAQVVTEMDWSGVVANVNSLIGTLMALAAAGASIYAKIGVKTVDEKAVVEYSPKPTDYEK